MLKFAIPGMWELQETNFLFLDIKNNHPEFFYDNIEIEAVYGNPQFCTWDGGRIFHQYNFATKEKLEEVIDIYNNHFHVPIRYIFTNNQLEEKHYHNRFCNMLMEIATKGNNEFVCADDGLAEYLKEQYPSFSCISSTTKCLLNKDDVRKEIQKDLYFRMCLDYNFNKSEEFLKELSKDYKDKIELLINPICKPTCPHRKEHYYLNSIYSLNYGKPYTMQGCWIKHGGNMTENCEKDNGLTYKEMCKYNELYGIEHFKIEGRTWTPIELILTYCKYMVKPEYQFQVISMCASAMEV